VDTLDALIDAECRRLSGCDPEDWFEHWPLDEAAEAE